MDISTLVYASNLCETHPSSKNNFALVSKVEKTFLSTKEQQ